MWWEGGEVGFFETPPVFVGTSRALRPLGQAGGHVLDALLFTVCVRRVAL